MNPTLPSPVKPTTYKPPNWLRGSTTVGGTYTGWNDYGQGTPDFGKGAGPGTPYHEVQSRVKAPTPVLGNGNRNIGMALSPSNAKIDAIRRRLGWGV